MPSRKRKGGLDDREISLIKAMIASGQFSTDQEILAYFTRPTRTVNQGRMTNIRSAMKDEPVPNASKPFVHQPAATDAELAKFLAEYPGADARTGLHLVGDELVIKAREAMLFAVQAFNNPTAYFKAEIFIVAAVIAWTYLLHAHLKRQGNDCIYRTHGKPVLTP